MAVRFALAFESLAGLTQFIVPVNALDGLLQPDGDEEADDDRGDVDEEVFPRMNGFVRRMDVEHTVLREFDTASGSIGEPGGGAIRSVSEPLAIGSTC
jgi:hypothetical protein